MDELKIVYLRVDDLTPYDRNTRKHSPKDIDQIKASIETDGFNDPIGVWGGKNLIVEGHGRLIAAKELGIERVPCIRLDHMTDAQRRDYAIRHNRTQELSSWDFDKLEEEIAALMLQGADLSDMKFALKALAEEDPEQEFVDAQKVEHHICPRCGHVWRKEES